MGEKWSQKDTGRATGESTKGVRQAWHDARTDSGVRFDYDRGYLGGRKIRDDSERLFDRVVGRSKRRPYTSG